LQATSSAFDLSHPTLQQLLNLQGSKPPVYQGLICKDPGPSAAQPIVMAYPDGPDISPSLVTSSGTLSLGPGMTNLSTLSGLTTFFPQEDAANLMVINEEQTAATTPLGDDLAALNTIKATFHRLCVVLPEPLSLWLTSSHGWAPCHGHHALHQTIARCPSYRYQFDYGHRVSGHDRCTEGGQTGCF
jgi:hypothetical protein